MFDMSQIACVVNMCQRRGCNKKKAQATIELCILSANSSSPICNAFHVMFQTLRSHQKFTPFTHSLILL